MVLLKTILPNIWYVVWKLTIKTSNVFNPIKSMGVFSRSSNWFELHSDVLFSWTDFK